LPFGGALAGAATGAAAGGSADFPVASGAAAVAVGAAGAAAAGSSAATSGGRDCRDREIALALGQLATFRQGNRGNVHRVIDLQRREIGDDRLGNGIRRNPHRDRVTHDVQAAALLEAGADILIDEMHRHLDTQVRPRLQAQKINMNRLIFDGIELVIARNDPLLGAADIELEDRGQEMPGVDQFVQLAIVERDRRGGIAAAVDHAWNTAFTAHAAGGPLACPVAHRGREGFRSGHSGVLEIAMLTYCASAPPGVSEGPPRRL